MLLWLQRVFIFLWLVISGRKRHYRFLREVSQHCRKRHNRRHVLGIAEELDDLDVIPENCLDDVCFVGFTKDGQVVSFRITRADREYAGLSIELPGVGRFSYSHSRSLELGHGPLRLQVLDPMRRWKVSFSGRVEHKSIENESELVHAYVSLYWQCLGDPFDHRSCLSNWELARNLASDASAGECIRYEQWGEMWGKVEIEGHESHFMRFKAFRKHQIAPTGYSPDETSVAHHIIQDNGAYYITNGAVCKQNGHMKETFGYIMLPVGERWVTDQSTLAVTERNSATTINYPVSVYSNGQTFQIDEVNKKNVPLGMKTDVSHTYISFTRNTINGKTAYGVTSHEDILFSKCQKQHTTEKKEASCSKVDALVIPLDHTDCRLATFVGGKASNLSVLSGLGLNVPNAICVTTKALEMQLDSNDTLRKSIELIASRTKDQNVKDQPQLCSKTVQQWQSSFVCDTVARSIHTGLVNNFGKRFEDIAFAVRSSGVKEDGTEASYAGQMESFLGVKGFDNILQAVSNCWASSFAYQVVEYRHQNGQPVIEPMGVIIQQMVDADVAGVLFTNDPVTGSTSTMVINAAPGLGEAVVSGLCTPDTVKIRRGNDLGKLKIVEKNVADKALKIVCATDSGVKQDSIDGEYGKKLCISDQQIFEICRLGGHLEDTIGHSQDIEWAISHGQLYLLQARPITSMTEETDEELLHEFDTPLAMEKESTTRYNLSEVFPGVASTLTQDIFVRGCSEAIGRFVMASSGTYIPKYACKTGLCFTNKPFLGMTAMSVTADCFLQNKASFEIALTGGLVDELTMPMIESFKGGPVSRYRSLRSFADTTLFHVPKYLKLFSAWEKTINQFSIGTGAASALDLYAAIDESMHYYYQIGPAHIVATTRSFIPYGIMHDMLKGKSSQVSNQVSADMAVMLANCPNVYTADVPRAIQKLAKNIAESDLKDTFLKLPDEDGHACLMNATSSVSCTYGNFLTLHGHRCVKEFELMEQSWSAEPRKLIRILKQLVNSPAPSSAEETTDIKSNSEIVEMLQTPLSWFQKFFIRTVLLDKAKAGIALRESTKSVNVKTMDAFKRAYWRLADFMVREGRLPDGKLLFFLTHLEIGALLESRSPALIRKAKRRMHLLPKQNDIQYPLISFGRPQPLKKTVQPSYEGSVSVQGMPVGKGVATGRACVVLTLDDADNIQRGDILICPYTDVGWSPYFPLIAGLVTDIGGLISHGAVVAREVGIPCIVNAVCATRSFSTGDRVRMDGLAGVVEKLDD